MKRRNKIIYLIIGIFIVAFCLVLFLVSESLPEATNVMKKEKGVTLNIVYGADHVSIPDPKTAGDSVQISFPSPIFWVNLTDEECEKYHIADFSFAGIKKPVQIWGYTVGSVQTKDASVAHINDLEAEGEEGEERKYDRKGNCLILQVQGQWGEDDELDSYVVVLDYANKKSYVTETSVIKIHQSGILQSKDVTGDGLDEILLTNYYSHGFMRAECYRFDTQKNKLITIYSTEDEQREKLEAKLVDNYQISLCCREKGFQETVSLLDAGYTEKECKKITKDNLRAPGVLEFDMKFVECNNKYVMRLFSNILYGSLASTIYDIGKVTTDFRYDKERDKLVIDQVKVKQKDDNKE